MRRVAWALTALLLLPALPATGGDEPADPAAALKARITALAHGELARLEIALAGPAEAGAPPALLPAVRIERVSGVRTFLAHLGEAALRHVLLLGAPAPAVARVTVAPVEGEDLVVDVTERAFRVLDTPTNAFVFQSPALLRWIEDRLETPAYDLRGEADPDLATLLAAFREHTAGLTREAQAEAGQAAAPRAGGPLVLDGDFEQELVVDRRGAGSPLGWDRVDGLTTFWKEDPFPHEDGKPHGRCLVMDTDVLESEWLKRKQEMAADPDSKPWPKTLVGPERQYAVVGATYGVSCYSDPIPIANGQAYRIDVDFRAARPNGGVAKLWVRGYGRLEVRGKEEWRRIYDSLHTLRTDDPTWHTYTNVFHPTKNTPHVERIRVMLYGYWPRGEYRWDDVRIEPISDEEYRQAKATERSDVR